jgi:hypothetical protein
MSSSIISRRSLVARAGFTIVELLVATAITLVVLGLMVQISFSVLGTFDKVTGTVTARTQASTVLRFLREDFQSIVWRRDGNVWLLATVQADQAGQGDANISEANWSVGLANRKPPGTSAPAEYGKEESSLRFDEAGSTGKWIDLKEHRFGHAGVWLRFFTNRTTPSSDGDVAPVAVSYQIVRMPPRRNSNESRYLFFRSQVRSGREATANPYSVADAGFNLALNTARGYNTPTAGANDDFGDPGTIRRPVNNNFDRRALIANNVIDFGVRFWRRVPPAPTDPADKQSTLQLIFPASAAAPFVPSENNLGFAVTALTPAQLDGLNSNNGIPYDGGLAAANLSTGFPDFVDIFIRVLTDEGARLIEAYEQGNLGAPPGSDSRAYWWKIAEEHSEVFTERIPIVARPI